METFEVVLAVGIISLLAFISKNLLFKKPRKLPPGPFSWPIIGNLHQLGELPHLKVHQWAQQYGDIMKIKYGMKTVIVASSPKWAEQFLKVHDAVFASRPQFSSGKYTGYNYQDMTWAPYGKHFRTGRKIYSTELFNPKRLESFEHIRVDERLRFLSSLYRYGQSGTPVKIADHIRRYTLSSISRTVMGDKYFTDFKSDTAVCSIADMCDMIDEWMILNGVFIYGDVIPFLRPFDFHGYIKRMKAVHARFDSFHSYVVGHHKKMMENDPNFVPKDMVDVLLTLTSEDTDPEMRLTMDAVKALIHDLMPGGTDTSGITLEWALHEIFRQPRLIEKAREELDRVIGRERWVEEYDAPNLPYIDAILKETFRLHPLSPLLAPHYALEDCNVEGYDIAKGTIIVLNTWSIGRHPDHWDDPLEFRPERFLEGKDIGVVGQDYSLLPFGSGRRRCPGYSLGLKIVRSTLSNLLHGFNWKFPEGKTAEDVCMEERYGLTTCPKQGVTMIPEPRLPDHLYMHA